MIWVLEETQLVDGAETRVVEEREWCDEALIEVSLYYYATCRQPGVGLIHDQSLLLVDYSASPLDGLCETRRAFTR